MGGYILPHRTPWGKIIQFSDRQRISWAGLSGRGLVADFVPSSRSRFTLSMNETCFNQINQSLSNLLIASVNLPVRLKYLEKIFSSKVLTLRLSKGKSTPDHINLLQSWRHSGFQVFCGPRIHPRKINKSLGLLQLVHWHIGARNILLTSPVL